MKQFYLLLTLTLASVLTATTQEAVAQQNLTIAAGDSVKYVAYLVLPLPPGVNIIKAQLAISTTETLGTDVANTLLFKAKTAAVYNSVADNPNKNNIEASQEPTLQTVVNVTDFVSANGFVRDNGGSMSLGQRLPGTYNLVLPKTVSNAVSKWWLVVDCVKQTGSSVRQFAVPFFLAVN